MTKEVAVREAIDGELVRLSELDHDRRFADAEVAVAKKAKKSNEELVPLMRKRLQAWREWGEALGPAEPGGDRKSSDSVSLDLSNAEKKDRERARKIAFGVDDQKFETYLAHSDPDKLTLAGLLRGNRERAAVEPQGDVEADGIYRILYVDPPWSYGSKNMDEYGAAEAHYWTLSTPDICDLRIDDQAVTDLCDDNAVLFLWATSPLLPDALAVIRAWGFTYKASFVWDKVKHNYGHYNSVRHEFLLIATKGSCLPDNSKLYDSVISIERSEKHSAKPAYFREMIDELYVDGKRLELFAREKSEGWDSWGSE